VIPTHVYWSQVKINEKDMVIAQLKSATHFFGEKIMELEDRSRSLQQQSSRATSSTGAAAATAAGESKNDVQGDEGVIDVVPPPVIRTPTASSARSFDDDDDDDDNNNNNASRKTPNRNKNIASPQTIEKDQAGGEAGGNESFATADDLP